MNTPPAPECHGQPMILRTPTTPEQEWEGDWWDCADPDCTSADLRPSPELAAFLDEQRAAEPA